jgi:cytochrome P450
VFVPRSSYNAGIKTIEKFVGPFIEEALSLSPEELAARTLSKYTFLHALASTMQDPKVLRDQIVAILLAGRDTTAAGFSWTIYELARHPEAFRKLRAEIIDTVGLDYPPTYRNLKDMKYLRVSPRDFLGVYVQSCRLNGLRHNSKSRWMLI